MTHGILNGLTQTGRMAAMDQFCASVCGLFARWLTGAGLFHAALRVLVVLLAVIGAPAISFANGLNDTGDDWCGDVSTMSVALCTAYNSDSSLYPRQDGNMGRDALARAGTLSKIGAGSKGFDFTKISSNGTELPATAAQGTGPNDWACTRDNVTGLLWEVKTTSGLHSSTDTFSWYQSPLGTPNGGTCQTGGNCDTQTFVSTVNATVGGFCGHNDWRMPSVKELQGLADFSPQSTVAIDTNYFPNTVTLEQYWTSTTNVSVSPLQMAWSVSSSTGAVSFPLFSSAYKVRLVSGTPVSRQLVLDGDTVRDSSHGLMWKLQYEMKLPGQPAPEFSTNPDTFDWSTAMIRAVNDRTGGYSDWRLPNIKELRSLANEELFRPALDPIFPAPYLNSDFWSSTVAKNFAGNLNYSWTLASNTGGISGVAIRTANKYVRLVRNLAVGQQTIGQISFSPTTVAVNGTTTASATATSGLPVTFSTTTSSICTVTSGGLVTALHAGSCVVAANQVGNTSFAPAPQVTQSITVNQAVQSIGTVSFLPVSLAINGTTTASATASSGGTVTFSVSAPAPDPLICSVAANVVTGLRSGTCSITASQAGGADYLAATSVIGTIAVKAVQVIGTINLTFEPIPVGTTSTASATGGDSGNAVTFTTSSPSTICEVTVGGLVTAKGVGSCVVIANQAGNTNYADATPLSRTIEISQGTQTIGPISRTPTDLKVGTTITLSASASSTGSSVAFLASPSTVCTVNGSTVTGRGVGACNVNAIKIDDPNFLPAFGSPIQINVTQGSQSIENFTLTPADLAVNGTTTASATGGPSGNSVVFTSDTPTICDVNGSLVTASPLGGLCTIRASQAQSANYAAADPVTLTIKVKNAQAITNLSFAPGPLAVNGTTTVSATPGASNLPVTYNSLSTNICTVSSATVTGKKVGSCIIAANQAGNDDYTPAPQETTQIQVTKGTQTIPAVSFSSTSLGISSTTTVSATASSGGTVTFSVTAPAPDPLTCSVAGTVVTGLSVGTCSITATQVNNPDFEDATSAPGTIPVKTGQTIGPISFTPSTLAVGGTTTAGATTTAGLTVTFTSATEDVCSVNDNIFRGVSVGTCFYFANQDGDATRAAASPVFGFIPVSQGTQTIGPVSFNPLTLSVGGTTTAIASTSSGYAASFTSSTTSVCTVNGSVVAGLAAGTCTITASQDGKQGGLQNYNAVTSAPQNVTVTGAVVAFNPISLSFADQHVNTTSAAKPVVLTNTGAVTLTISSIQVTTTPNDYVVSGCGSSLAAGASCNLSVSFKPTALAGRIATLKVIGNNATDSPIVSLSGVGIASNVPICTLTAAPPRVASGKPSTLTASCSPTPTSYTWTGVGCAGNTTATCTVSPGATTIFGVTGTNGSVSSVPVSATVTVGAVDLTPILMLLLD